MVADEQCMDALCLCRRPKARKVYSRETAHQLVALSQGAPRGQGALPRPTDSHSRLKAVELASDPRGQAKTNALAALVAGSLKVRRGTSQVIASYGSLYRHSAA